MSDFTRNYFIDPGITIKEEPLTNDGIMIINNTSSSASVPIPASTKRTMDLKDDYRDFGIEIENSQSPLYQDNNSLLGQIQTSDEFNSGINTTTMWGNRLIIGDETSLKNDALIHMDDDDIFQVDKADLIQGPTLAELNANDDTLLGDLNFDDLLLPEEGGTYLTLSQKQPNLLQINILNNNFNNQLVQASSSCPQSSFTYRDLDVSSSNNLPSVSALSPTNSHNSSNSPQFQSSPSHMSTLQQKHSTLHELLIKRDNSYVSPEHNSLPGCSTPPATPTNLRLQRLHQQQSTSSTSRLSSSAPTHLGLEQLWQRREPRKHLLSTGSLAEAGSTSSISTGGILSPDPNDFSHDEYDDSDDESDGDHHYEDVSSDDSDNEHPSKHSSSKKERYFWQYNVQAKGPKGQRLVMKTKMEDPHVLHEITDPVFSPDCSVRGIKHSGKARKGDGNDLTPNAKKLFNIGKELDKLGRVINDMTPVSELPFNVRPKSRKEKNKLASRACRLKKKAQHEANKIKLSGLEVEHKNVLNGIIQCKELIMAKLQELSPEKQEELSANIDNTFAVSTKFKVAGQTTEYVNKILDRLKKGQSLVGVGVDDF